MSNVVALSLIADLLFSVQIEEAANRLGFRVSTVSTPKNAVSALQQGRASLFIMDLTAAGERASEVVQVAKAAPYPVAVLAFGPHANCKACQAAQDAGADLVVSRDRFSRELAQLMITCLDRHRESVSTQRGNE